MSDLARTYERMKDIGREQREALSFKDIGDFYPFIRSCFPESDNVLGTSFLKLLITVYGIFDIKFKEDSSCLLPIIYLYGPEIVEHEMILSRHPVIDSQGGTLVNGVVYEEIESKESHKEDLYDVRLIKILDEAALNQIRKKYEEYIEPIELISKLFLEHNLKEQITLSYNAVFKRAVFKKSHNVLGIREATGDVVWRTLCRNLKRMEEWPKPKYLKFFKDASIILPNDKNKIPTQEVNIDYVHNQLDVKDCLKGYGTKNDLVTFEAIYLLNIRGYPTGTRAGPLFPRLMKKSEYLYRLVSPYYFNALRNYQFYLHEQNLTPATIENPKSTQYYRFGEIGNAIQKFKEVQEIRNQVKNVMDQSIKNLQSQHLLEETKSSFVIKKRPIYVDEERREHYEIDLPSLSEIKSVISQIYKVERHIKEESAEWQFKRKKRREKYLT